MADVFVSYSAKDRDFVRKLHEALKELNRDTWVDWQGIPPTSKWKREIFAAIDAADNFAFVISPESVLSRMCREEVAHAVRNNKRLIPIVLRPVAPAELPPPLADFQWISFADVFERAVGRLIEALDTDLEWKRAHTRLLARANEWETNTHDESFLLRGMDLQGALEWLVQAPTIKEQMPSELQREYIKTSQEWQAGEIDRLKKLNEEKERQRQEAERQGRIASARELVALSLINQSSDPELSVLLAMYSVAKTLTSGQGVLPESEQQLHKALSLSRVRSTFVHDDPVKAIAWSPGGQHLATGSEDGTTRVWDLNSRRVTWKVRSRSDTVVSLSWSGDGESLAIGTQRGTVMVCRAEDGRQLLAFQTSASLSGLAWSPVSNRIATTENPTFGVNVWDGKTGKKKLSLKLDGPLMSVAWSRDGKRLASGRLNGDVTVWDAERGKKLITLSGHDKGPTPVAWSPNGERLLTGGGRDHTAKTWDVETGKELLKLIDHTVIITSVAWSPDSRRLATASRDKNAKIWDAETGKELLVLSGHRSEISGVAWSPDNRRLATASLDKTARVWDTEAGEEYPTLNGHTDIVRSVAWSPEGKRLATSSRDGTARIWNATNGREMQVVEKDSGNISSVAWSPDGQRLAVATHPSIWDVRAGQHVLDLTGHENYVNCIAWSPNGEKLATGSNDQTVRIWDSASGQNVLTLRGGAETVAWNPDGLRLATGSAEVMIWSTNNAKLLSTLSTSHQASVLGIAWSPDGGRIAAAYDDGSTIIWSAGTEKELLTLTGHDFAVYAIAWSPDGKRLATGSLDHTARVWDATSGARLVSLLNQNANVFSVAWSPDSKRLAVATGHARGAPASGNDTVRIYAMDIHDLMALAQRRVTRDLTQEECHTYLHLAKPSSARLWRRARPRPDSAVRKTSTQSE